MKNNMHIGCDIAKVGRFADMNDNFLEKYFSEREINHVKSYNRHGRAEVIAGLFAAKEAVLKALGVGMGNGISLCDIEIFHEDEGRPYAKLSEKITKFAGCEIEISISHTTNDAMAVALVTLAD